MVNSLQLKVIGTAGLVVGLLILLWGLLMLEKQWLATGFVVIIIAVTLLYYGKRLGEMGDMNKGPADMPAMPSQPAAPPRGKK